MHSAERVMHVLRQYAVADEGGGEQSSLPTGPMAGMPATEAVGIYVNENPGIAVAVDQIYRRLQQLGFTGTKNAVQVSGREPRRTA